MSGDEVSLACEPCGVVLASPFLLTEHLGGKRHKKVVAARELRGEQEGRAVYVTCLGSLKQQDIREHFSTYGEIHNISVGEDKNNPALLHHAIIQFVTADSATAVLAPKVRHSHKVGSQRLKVFERKFRERERSPSPPSCPSISFSQLKLRLSLLVSPEEQVLELASLATMGEQQRRERVDICRHIMNTFARNGFPECIVYPFGSSVTGLGLPGCDLDIYIWLGWGGGQQEQERVRQATRVLRTIPQCARVQPITQARVPIVKFVHRPTGINCDISFKNRLSVCNTEYIRVMSDQDPRIRPLLVIIRYFCSHFSLSGGGGGLKMSSYCLTILVIFYLQQLPQPLLHSVRTLQQDTRLQEDSVEGWNCAFSKDMNQLPDLIINDSSIIDLLKGFFKFYSELDFSRTLICPLLGKCIPKSLLKDEVLVNETFPNPDQFLKEPNLLQTDKALCIQDPFELSHNVGRNLPEKSVRRIKLFFEEAFKVLEQEDQTGGILNLFNITIDEDISDEKDAKSSLKLLNQQGTKLEEKFLSVIPFKFDITTEYCSFEAVISKTLEIVRVLLEECLLLEVHRDSPSHEVSETFKTDLKRSMSPLDTDKKVKLSEDLLFSPCGAVAYREGPVWDVWHAVWAARKKTAVGMEDELSSLSVGEREAAISRAVVNCRARLETPQVILGTHILVHKGLQEWRLWLGLHKVHSRLKEFTNLVTWLKPYANDVIKRAKLL